MPPVTCEFVNRTEKCKTCKKEVKKGFLVGNGEFVCSEECAKAIDEDFQVGKVVGTL